MKVRPSVGDRLVYMQGYQRRQLRYDFICQVVGPPARMPCGADSASGCKCRVRPLCHRVTFEASGGPRRRQRRLSDRRP